MQKFLKKTTLAVLMSFAFIEANPAEKDGKEETKSIYRNDEASSQDDIIVETASEAIEAVEQAEVAEEAAPAQEAATEEVVAEAAEEVAAQEEAQEAPAEEQEAQAEATEEAAPAQEAATEEVVAEAAEEVAAQEEAQEAPAEEQEAQAEATEEAAPAQEEAPSEEVSAEEPAVEIPVEEASTQEAPAEVQEQYSWYSWLLSWMNCAEEKMEELWATLMKNLSPEAKEAIRRRNISRENLKSELVSYLANNNIPASEDKLDELVSRLRSL